MANKAEDRLRKYLSANCSGGLFPTLGDDAEAAIDRINHLEREAEAHVTHTTERETKYRETFLKLEKLILDMIRLQEKLDETYKRATTAQRATLGLDEGEEGDV